MNKLTLGKQITCGFALILLITIALGCLSSFKMRTVSVSAHKLSDQYAPEVEICSRLQVATLDTMHAIRSFSYSGDKKYFTEAEAGMRQIETDIKEAKALVGQYPSLIKLKEEIADFDQSYAEFSRLVRETKAKSDALDKTRTDLNKFATDFVELMDAYQSDEQNLMRTDITAGANAEKLEDRTLKLELSAHVRTMMNQIRIAVWKFQANRDSTLLQELPAHFVEIQNCFSQIAMVTTLAQHQQKIKAMQNASESYKAGVEQLTSDWQVQNEIAANCSRSGASLAQNAAEIVSAGMKNTLTIATDSSQSLDKSTYVNLVGLLVAVLLGSILAFFTVRGITHVVKDIARRLAAGADQTAAASGQISGASQSLAEGASEQAANLEETSASLEEINSMVKRNAEAADKAKVLASETRLAAEAGTVDMAEMNHAMNDIKTSSDDIGKIIKTIDEIAFQTNILALNAAVEAARAGEAGMGFAVVADEVRNLAQRSAQSAQETSAKIGAAIAKSERGVQISAKVATNFNEIAVKTRQVDQYVGEIATASKEQANGVDQVNIAVTQMDKVTQSNAANAEETASAAEELNAQAKSVQDAVIELERLVGIQPAASLEEPAHQRPKSAGSNGHATLVNGRKKSSSFALPSTRNTSALVVAATPEDDDFKNF
jgi:methyl-accepting chemotaxis protein